MSFDMSRFERGQVWMVRFKHPEEQVGHEQKKDRPWLVLSVGKFNTSSSLVTMVPISTRDETKTPSQVLFYNDRGVKNAILCEQVRTFDYRSGAYIFDFMGNLSNEVLERVDVALSIHLGLHYSPITLKNLYDTMEAIIKSVSYMQEKDSSPKFSEEDVKEFTNIMKSMASDVLKDTHPETVEPTPILVTKVEEREPREYDLPTVEEKEEPKKPKSTRMKWDIETAKKFIDDANSYPMKVVMEKWGISKKTRFYSMKNYAATLLMKETKE